MSKSLFILPLCLLLLSLGLPAFADQYDDCKLDCDQPVAPCVEQARLTAGNVQEEQDLIAACQKNKTDCIQACKEAEVQAQTPPQDQPQDQQQQPQDMPQQPQDMQQQPQGQPLDQTQQPQEQPQSQ